MNVYRLTAIFALSCVLAACATSEFPESTSPIRVSQSGITLRLSQPWNASPDAAFQPGIARLAWTPTALVVSADLTDREVFTNATGDNQSMWELGDAIEMFIQVEGRTDYVELHIVPTNHKLHLHLPGIRGRVTSEAKPATFDQMLVTPVGFTSEVTRTATGWKVDARVPADVLGLQTLAAGQRLRISFSRYNATGNGDPILSTTAAHPVLDFHRPDDWTKVELTFN